MLWISKHSWVWYSRGAAARSHRPRLGMSPGPCLQKDISHEDTSSPKLDSQFFHWGLPLVRNGLGSLQNVSEFLQFFQCVSQLAAHCLKLSLQDLDLVDADELVSLTVMECLLQIHRWDRPGGKHRKQKNVTEACRDYDVQTLPCKNKAKEQELCNLPSSVLLSSSFFMEFRLSCMRLIWEVLVATSLLRRCSSNSLVNSSPRHFAISDATWLQRAQERKHIV